MFTAQYVFDVYKIYTIISSTLLCTAFLTITSQKLYALKSTLIIPGVIKDFATQTFLWVCCCCKWHSYLCDWRRCFSANVCSLPLTRLRLWEIRHEKKHHIVKSEFRYLHNCSTIAVNSLLTEWVTYPNKRFQSWWRHTENLLTNSKPLCFF